ncbi:azaleucine resistance protein AzlC [Paenibacillus donghaensis]|uniref:Azaleucine resistance protein AzlC n=1 Tax=Paenibacillus donghaensis TaxID=414771 RepID=A0A2Z2K3C9_9BACL|nr:azaleucine resistance protein AzlC [Paenibacillus donghaensis]ASA19786.1 azaleucine resistance protein AzlC [Paenibacillus donghaensis]
MTPRNKLREALKAAFPPTIPIMAGFMFLGIAYGILMNLSGFNAIYAVLMALLIFAGSMEFVAVNLLLSPFNPLGALLMTLMVNARHLFYGISMLERYKGTGFKKIYLIFGLCDESFSINYTADIPPNVDRGWYMFFVTALNHCYWVVGAAIGGIFGSLVTINMEGLEFVMIALFVVIFIEQWMKEDKHHSALLGLGISIVCLMIFNRTNFIIPSMIGLLVTLSLLRRKLEKKAGESVCQ